jgi:hypothetical protein
MDVVEASHLQVIQNFLTDNPDLTFKMRRFEGNWTVGVTNLYDETDFYVTSSPSFKAALRDLCVAIVAAESNDNHSPACGCDKCLNTPEWEMRSLL